MYSLLLRVHSLAQGDYSRWYSGEITCIQMYALSIATAHYMYTHACALSAGVPCMHAYTLYSYYYYHYYYHYSTPPGIPIRDPLGR